MILALVAVLVPVLVLLALVHGAPRDPSWSDLRHRPLAGDDDRCRLCGHRLDDRERHPSWWRIL